MQGKATLTALVFVLGAGVVLLMFGVQFIVWRDVSALNQSHEAVAEQNLPAFGEAVQLARHAADLQSTVNALVDVQNHALLDRRLQQSREAIDSIRSLVTRRPVQDPHALNSALSTMDDTIADIAMRLRARLDNRPQLMDSRRDLIWNIDRTLLAMQTASIRNANGLMIEVDAMRGRPLIEGGLASGWQERIASIEATILRIDELSESMLNLTDLRNLTLNVGEFATVEHVKAAIQKRDFHLRALVSIPTRRAIVRGNDSSSGIAELYRLARSEQSVFQYSLERLEINEQIGRQAKVLTEATDTILAISEDTLAIARQAVNDSFETVSLGLAGVWKHFVMALLFLGAGFVVLLHFLVGRRVVQPVQQLTASLQYLGSDDYSPANKRYAVRELQELQAAVDELNATIFRLRDKERELEDNNVELQRLNTSLSQFAHAASHDLQEPLRKIRQFSSLLEEDYRDRLDQDGRYFIDTITHSATRMSALIRDVLAYSRSTDSGLTKNRIDLSGLIDDVLAELDDVISDANARIEVSELPGIRGNPAAVSQLFRNLIANAVKYRHPDRQVVVRIASRLNSEGSHHVLSVSDNGRGIDSRHFSLIMEPFKRLDNTDRIKGSGIGLAICNNVCDVHGWHLSVSSTPGAGAEFGIEIPVETTMVIDSTSDADPSS